MKVVILGDYPVDKNQIWGGEQAAFSYLVEELCRIDDLEVHIFTIAGPSLAGQTRTEESGAMVHFFPSFPRFELFRRFSTYQTWVNGELSEIRPDIVHAQGALHHGYVALRTGYPAVITVHGVQGEDRKYQSTFYLRFRKWFVSQFIERNNLGNTLYLIAISRYVTAYFSNLLRQDVKIHYIPNAIDTKFFNLEDTSEGNTVLFAGRVIQRKRVFDLVQAFAEVVKAFPQAQLRIAGEFQSEVDYVEKIRNFIKKTNLNDSVRLLGNLPESEVLREFAACDVLALPSAQETTPMVIAQAMAAAKPVVATPVGGVAEMISDQNTGLLVPLGDIQALAQALLSILKDTSLRKRLGTAASRFAVENYRADNVARRTYDVYHSMSN